MKNSEKNTVLQACIAKAVNLADTLKKHDVVVLRLATEAAK